jgi:hypothetical protein
VLPAQLQARAVRHCNHNFIILLDGLFSDLTEEKSEILAVNGI